MACYELSLILKISHNSIFITSFVDAVREGMKIDLIKKQSRIEAINELHHLGELAVADLLEKEMTVSTRDPSEPVAVEFLPLETDTLL